MMSLLLDALGVMISQVDCFRWWRLMLCLVATAVAAIACYNLGSASAVYPSLLALLVGLAGLLTGFIWEYRTRQR